VGVLYLNGEGVPANPTEALKWVDLALASDPKNPTYLKTRQFILERLRADSAAGR
jgi:TPR repeat protein